MVWRDDEGYRARGVEFFRPPEEQPHGLAAVFKDLYGNTWDLLQPNLLNRSWKLQLLRIWETVGFASALGTGEVMLGYVPPSAQFAGVGKMLLGATEEHAARAGVDALHLESTRTARPF